MKIDMHRRCSICGSTEHTKARHGKPQRWCGTNENPRCSVCGAIGHNANWHKQDVVKNQTEKLCKKCNRVLSISSFWKVIRKNRSAVEYTWYNSKCKECVREKCRENSKKYHQRLRKTLTIERVFVMRMHNVQYRVSHLRTELECDIDVPYVTKLFQEQDGKCFFSGAEMTTSGSSSVSIDRIDSEKGYTKGNVVLCTAAINRMKNDHSMETFIDVCGKVWKHRGDV